MERKIDVHTHIGKEPGGLSCSIEERLLDMQKHNVAYSVIFPFGEGDLIENSLKLLEAAKENSQLIPFLRFNPKLMTLSKLKELLTLNFKGVKLHPSVQNFDPLNPEYFIFYKLIAQRGIPILFHTTKTEELNCDPDRIALLAYKIPELKVILGHYASKQPVTKKLLKDQKNLFVETSLFATVFGIKQWVDFLGSEQILYGTDHPFSFHELESLKIKLAKISEEDKQNIFYNNAAKLFNLE